MRRTRINSKWLSNCTGKELQQLNRLRLKGDSMMYEDVILAPFYRDRMRVFLLKEYGNIIGWSVTILPITEKEYKAKPFYPTNYGTNYAPVYTYVHSKCRKAGYGRRLLTAASKFCVKNGVKPCVFFWNEASSRFFAGVNEGYPALEVFDCFEWWDLFKRG